MTISIDNDHSTLDTGHLQPFFDFNDTKVLVFDQRYPSFSHRHSFLLTVRGCLVWNQCFLAAFLSASLSSLSSSSSSSLLSLSLTVIIIAMCKLQGQRSESQTYFLFWSIASLDLLLNHHRLPSSKSSLGNGVLLKILKRSTGTWFPSSTMANVKKNTRGLVIMGHQSLWD